MSKKINFSFHIPKHVSLTVEKTVKEKGREDNKTYYPTLSFDLREPKKDENQVVLNSFNNDTKMSLQLDPFSELPEFISVLLTYNPSCQFSFHGDRKNHSLSAEWDTAGNGSLKIAISFAGSSRYIKLPRAKVTELAFFACDQLSHFYQVNQTISAPCDIAAIDTIMSRTYRRFKEKTY